MEKIIAAINEEISRLEQAKALLSETAVVAPKTTKATAGAGAKQGTRNLTPEARQRIRDAQNRRWAAVRAQNRNQ